MANSPKDKQGSQPANDPKNRPETPARPSGDARPDSKKPAPYYDDRPAQQRGGSGDTQKPDAPRNPKTPHYGDKEEGDPRRLDVDASDQQRPKGRSNPS